MPKNRKKAFRLMQRAAYKSDVTAMRHLGRYYEKGIGCRRSMIHAKTWYAKAVTRGSEAAKTDLRRCEALAHRSSHFKSARYGAARY